MFFQLFWTIKVKLVDEITQIAYLWLILHVKHKNKTFIAVLTRFLILCKIQDVGQDEPIKTWKKHMCREARAEMTVTNAWSWILIGSENEGRYASWSASLSIDPSNPLFLPWILKPRYNFVANRGKYRYMTWIIYPLCLLISLSAWKWLYCMW